MSVNFADEEPRDCWAMVDEFVAKAIPWLCLIAFICVLLLAAGTMKF